MFHLSPTRTLNISSSLSSPSLCVFPPFHFSLLVIPHYHTFVTRSFLPDSLCGPDYLRLSSVPMRKHCFIDECLFVRWIRVVSPVVQFSFIFMRPGYKNIPRSKQRHDEISSRGQIMLRPAFNWMLHLANWYLRQLTR